MALGEMTVDIDTKTRIFGPMMFVRGIFSHRGNKLSRHYWFALRVPIVGLLWLSVGKWSAKLTISR